MNGSARLPDLGASVYQITPAPMLYCCTDSVTVAPALFSVSLLTRVRSCGLAYEASTSTSIAPARFTPTLPSDPAPGRRSGVDLNGRSVEPVPVVRFASRDPRGCAPIHSRPAP